MSLKYDQVLQALRDLNRTGKGSPDPARLALTIANESDRGAVLLAAAMLEDLIYQTLLERLPGNKKDIDGIASDFGRKIRLAAAVGIIEEETRKRLDLIRNLRNACAHLSNDLTFDHDVMIGVLNLLVKEADPPLSALSAEKRKALFAITCAVMGTAILRGGIDEHIVDGMMPFFENVLSRYDD